MLRLTFAFIAALAATGRFGRRAALRALLVLGLRHLLPRSRTEVTAPLAAAAGATLEQPAMGLAMGATTVGAALRKGVRPEDLAFDVVMAGLLAVATRRWWPVAPRTPADVRPALTRRGTDPRSDGDGLAVVVNPNAGSIIGADPAKRLEDELPAAEVIVTEEGDDIPAALEKAASSAVAIGIAGGDGSINAAAGVAHQNGKPLMVIPAGTLNHFARDLGIATVADAVEAVRSGSAAAVDLAMIAEQPFLNTASFGTYVELVDARERLEGRIGKWPAVFVALAQVLRKAEPVEVDLDGRRRRIWMIFIGNCVYHPAGFAPAWRERLDDGRLDVRVVDADQPYARLRLLLAVLTGRLGRSRVYETWTTRRLEVRSHQGPLRLARDGETFDGPEEFVVCKSDEPLTVYVPS